MPKVLISDKMNPRAADIFRENGCEVDVITGQTPEELKEIIGNYDGLAIRSSTTVTAELLEAATKLKVIGRAGIGVDNVDIPAASAKGVVVMNTPFGNSITSKANGKNRNLWVSSLPAKPLDSSAQAISVPSSQTVLWD
jgi:D-3-phosphoglycerate dehydrogenase